MPLVMNALVSFRRRSLYRSFAGAALFTCLLLRTLIPLGYMPGNLLAGEFMTLCPQGLPGESAHQLHDLHGNPAVDVVATDRLCPLGNALLAVAPPPSPPADFDLPRPGDFLSVTLDAPPESSPVLHYASRAPPRRFVITTS